MKISFALILCGLVYASASPNCDERQAYNCAGVKAPDPDHFYPETEADAIDFCRDILLEMNCQIDFAKRCPNTLVGATRGVLETHKEVFTKLCDESTLRQKLVEKASCINVEMERNENGCSETVEEEGYCERFDPLLICAEEKVNQACGNDGREVYAELFKPRYAYKKIFCD